MQLAVSLVALRLLIDLLLMQADKYRTNWNISLLLQSTIPLFSFWKMNELMVNCIFNEKVYW